MKQKTSTRSSRAQSLPHEPLRVPPRMEGVVRKRGIKPKKKEKRPDVLDK